jgi:hypothetical protein
MNDPATPNPLDGVWWPRSRDLAAELADLVDHFPAERFGRVVRVLVSAADWEVRPRHALVRGGYVKIGVFAPEDDDHMVHLITTDRALFQVLVVPPAFTREQGDRALRAATNDDNRDAGAALLSAAAVHLVGDGTGRWSDPIPL